MTESKVHELLIRTPEGISFSYALAGPVTRGMAWLVDVCVIGAVALAFNIVLSMTFVFGGDLAQALLILNYFVVTIGYGILLEWTRSGQTVGKRLLRLRVIDCAGFRLSFGQVFLRNLLRAVDCLPMLYLIGGTVCLFSRHAQRLGDLAAGTVVIRLPRLVEPDLAQIPEGKFNSLLAYPHLAARLRQNVSPEEAALIVQALMRRETLDPDRRLELYRDLAGYFRAKTEFPQEALDGISDEQYLRNVLGVVFMSRTQ